MGEISENIRSTFSNLIQIYEETADLFLDADDLMSRTGHKILKGSALESASSRSLNYPRWWFVFSGVRYYVPEDDPKIARTLGVFFLDSSMEPIDPLVVFGAIRALEEESEDEIEPYGVTWEAWNKGVSDHSLKTDLEFGALKKAEGGRIRGVKLEDVVDRGTLEELVINPLLEMG